MNLEMNLGIICGSLINLAPILTCCFGSRLSSLPARVSVLGRQQSGLERWSDPDDNSNCRPLSDVSNLSNRAILKKNNTSPAELVEELDDMDVDENEPRTNVFPVASPLAEEENQTLVWAAMRAGDMMDATTTERDRDSDGNTNYGITITSVVTVHEQARREEAALVSHIWGL